MDSQRFAGDVPSKLRGRTAAMKPHLVSAMLCALSITCKPLGEIVISAQFNFSRSIIRNFRERCLLASPCHVASRGNVASRCHVASRFLVLQLLFAAVGDSAFCT